MVTQRISMWMAALASLIFLPGGLNEKIRSLTVKPGDSVTLQTGLTGLDGGHILWIYDSSRRLLLCSEGIISDPPEEYEGRLDLDPSSGSLTISNVRKSAVYRGEMLKGNEKLVFDYSVIVGAWSCFTHTGSSCSAQCHSNCFLLLFQRLTHVLHLPLTLLLT